MGGKDFAEEGRGRGSGYPPFMGMCDSKIPHILGSLVVSRDRVLCL